MTETDVETNGTLYNTLLVHDEHGSLVLKQRKLVPTNHERLVWGQGDGAGLRAAPRARADRRSHLLGELHAARALRPLGVAASDLPGAAADGEAGTSLVHIARESRASSSARRTSSAPPPIRRIPLPTSSRATSSGEDGSEILGPEGAYLDGPLYDEEGILYAELDPLGVPRSASASIAAGHDHRPDVFRLDVSPIRS